jgi:hypothetical protein
MSIQVGTKCTMMIPNAAATGIASGARGCGGIARRQRRRQSPPPASRWRSPHRLSRHRGLTDPAARHAVDPVGWARRRRCRCYAAGELFVLAFFGVGAVAALLALLRTPWLCCVVGGIALNLFAAAVLMVNNHRAKPRARLGRKALP